jgi:hypothetical protein
MSQFLFDIRRQSPPTRCEVCHQSDCFDPETDRCLRCEEWIQVYAALATVPVASPFRKEARGGAWFERARFFVLIFLMSVSPVGAGAVESTLRRERGRTLAVRLAHHDAE